MTGRKENNRSEYELFLQRVKIVFCLKKLKTQNMNFQDSILYVTLFYKIWIVYLYQYSWNLTTNQKKP